MDAQQPEGLGAPQIARLPRHLRQLVVDQQWERYTPMDHALWRYILRQAVRILATRAHPIYLEGLRRTGINLEQIPRIEEMNRVLEPIGWGAASVDGFIPPAAFMEFQANRVLVIAAQMRQMDHAEYTPAPDIVHEAAGHAPIILDAAYAEYLRRFGEVGTRALPSKADRDLYEAIRRLSIVKEQPGAARAAIAAAERAVAEAQAAMGEPSEMAQLSRLHWWTVEYGLIGERADPRLYGAGLLSSIGEAVTCLSPEVEKLPYSLEAQHYPYDITTRQPRLFVTPSFPHLTEVLEAFASTMACAVGGVEGLRRAAASQTVATARMSSGLEVSGAFADLVTGGGDQPVYLQTRGPSALAFRGAELPGQGTEVHRDGFGSPVGRLESSGTPLEQMSDAELDARGIRVGRRALLHFESGVLVTGQLERVERREGKVVLLRLTDCKVTLGSLVLYQPEWGPYELAVGARVTSVFAGAADQDAFEGPGPAPVGARARTAMEATAPPGAAALYARARALREGREAPAEIGRLWGEARRRYPGEWLLSLELLEVAVAQDLPASLRQEIRLALEEKARERPALAKVIGDGLAGLSEPGAASGTAAQALPPPGSPLVG